MTTTKFGSDQYSYLDPEDRAFAQCFRLTEDQFLEMAGGLKKYTEHRLNRRLARGASIENALGEKTVFDVPKLPSDTAAAMSLIQLPGLSEQEFASYLLKEQITKVAGIMGALQANRQFKSQAEREAQDKTSIKEGDLAKLRREAANTFGWSESSQSARDWAEQKYAERYASKRGF